MSAWRDCRLIVLAWMMGLLCLVGISHVRAAETMPPAPAAYFNDYAGVVDKVAGSALDKKLRQFERDSSNQIVVAVFSKLETDSSVADYTQRIAASWRVGQKGLNNGAVLFVFVEAHKVFIQVGYGLEGALPDATCKRIIDEQITPAFKAGDFKAGLNAGVDSMIKATRGEYTGSGRVVGDGSHSSGSHGSGVIPVLVILFVILVIILNVCHSGTVYNDTGSSVLTIISWIASGVFSNLGGSSGGGGGGGGGSSDGGGFSGGGGDFGGGGAGGDW